MSFRITGLSAEPFRPLFGLSDAALAERGVLRYVADAEAHFPCRVEMRDVDPGEAVLLLNHVCQPAATPYRASHAIFVREGAETRFEGIDVVPQAMRTRLLSLRAYDAAGMMRDAEVVEGSAMEAVIERLLADPQTAYLHAHNARRGCYSGRIERA